MRKYLLLSLLTACAVDLTADEQALVNGQLTSGRQAVGIFTSGLGGSQCTATLISPLTFITEGDCSPFDGGAFITFPNGTTAQVARIFRQGDQYQGNDDLAVGLLEAPVTTIMPATIATREPIKGDLLTVVGFGCTTRNYYDGFYCEQSRRFVSYTYTGADTYYNSHDNGDPTFLGSLTDTGGIVRIAAESDWYTGADDSGDPVKYRSQLLDMSVALQVSGVAYRSQVQGIGWQGAVWNGLQSGTVGASLRLEGLQVWTRASERICYTAFVQDQGWQTEVCDGETAGTVGQGKRMEAIKIRRSSLDGTTPLYIRYRTYLEGLGWQPYVSNNTISGTTGQARRIEAIEILETPAVSVPPGGTGIE